MKALKTILKKELKELFNQKGLLSLLFLGIILLDALGAIFPKYLNRQITLFLAIPLIFVIHILKTRKISKLFLLSLILNFLGIYNFNHPYEKYNALGLIYHALGFFIYFIILFRRFKIVSIKRILKYAALIILFVIVPTVIYSEGMSKRFIFSETMFYVFCLTLFVFSAIFLYVNNKTKANLYLFLSAISVTYSAYVQGYNLFVESLDILEFLAIILFDLTHFFMCWYVIIQSRKKAP